MGASPSPVTYFIAAGASPSGSVERWPSQAGRADRGQGTGVQRVRQRASLVPGPVCYSTGAGHVGIPCGAHEGRRREMRRAACCRDLRRCAERQSSTRAAENAMRRRRRAGGTKERLHLLQRCHVKCYRKRKLALADVKYLITPALRHATAPGEQVRSTLIDGIDCPAGPVRCHGTARLRPALSGASRKWRPWPRVIVGE